MIYLRQSTASQSVLIGPFIDDTDGKTAETGLTIANTDIRLSKNGANIAAKNSGGGTHDELGYYTITLDATDTDTVGRLQIAVHVTGALPVYHEYQVLEEAVYDISFASGATGAVPSVTAGVTVTTNNDKTGYALSAAGVDAILDETLTAHVTADSLGVAIKDILADTNELQADDYPTTLATLATASALATAQTDLDTITGSDGVTLATAQALYAPAKAGDSMALTAGAVDAILDETLTAHVTADSLGVAVKDILADTNELQTDDYPTTLATLATSAALATVDSNVDAILVDTGTTLPGILGTPTDFGSGTSTLAANLQDLADNGTATYDRSTDSLQAIRDRGDAAWTTGAGGTPPQLLQSTTIATLASQTSFTLTAGSADDDAYNGAVIVVTDQATSTQKAVGSISDYVGSTRTVTLAADPAIFTMATGDTVNIIAALGTGPTAAAIADAVWDEAQADHVTAGTFGIVASEVADILVDTAEIGAAGAGLTAINLPDQTMNITGNITGNLSGSVNSVTTGVTVTTNNDKTGYALSTAGVDAVADQVWDEALTAAAHNVANSAGRRLRNIQDFGIYDLASVWVDEVAGTSTGTVDGEDATVTNRANDFDNAQTVADSIGITSIRIQNGNSITLTAALEGYEIYGNGATLALGTQNIGGTIFRQLGNITGVGTTLGNRVFFEDCIIGNVTLPPSVLRRTSLTGTLTVGSAGDFQLLDSQSGVAGSGTPTIDLGAAVGATTLELRRWSGGVTLSNVQTGDVVSVDVVSGGTITVNGTGGTVVVRGLCNVVDGSSGAVTITETSVVNMTKINTEADTAISDAALATASSIAALNDLSAAQVNAEVVDALATDTYAEPGQEAPAATASLSAKINYLYKAWRNRSTQTATTYSLYNDAGTTVDQKATVADDTTTADKGVVGTGP